MKSLFSRLILFSFFISFFAALTGCAGQGVPGPANQLSAGHITGETSAEVNPDESSIPDVISASPELPAPEPFYAEATHTVVVYDVPVKELLFSLARDSALNLDVGEDIDVSISINAIEQPLTSLLDRISRNAGLRYQIQNGVLRVERDTPFLRTYAVDYLNIARTSIGSVAVSTQISSTGAGAGSSSGDSGNTGNSSDTLVRNVTEHAFWATLEDNIGKILGRTTTEGNSASNPDIIMNSESGTIAVRATKLQHNEIGRFIAIVQKNSQRQVLIEATIAEVSLSDSYQGGIDWNLINSNLTSGVEINQNLSNVALASPPTFNLTLSDLDLGGNELQATLRALETFGDVSVMSSPKVMAMNNQTALLKVVDNLIYFTVEVNIDTSSSALNGGNLTTFETEVNTVPVGFVMSVTPFIDDADSVILNVRPTISRVISFAQDPNPALADANVVSSIPVIQVREVESVLKVDSGNIAVIGGLMQDQVKRNVKGVPMLGKLPLIGRAFRFDDDSTEKTELVIFLKPTVIHKASIAGDLKSFDQFLPRISER